VSSYLTYQNSMRETFRLENPGMTFGQLAKFTSSMYKSLSPEEKSRWEEAAAQDKSRFEFELLTYQPPPGFDGSGNLMESHIIGLGVGRKKKKGKDPNAPKRARGSYVFFTLDARPRILEENPNLTFREIGHAMGERWRALSAEDKQKYDDLANNDKKRFKEEIDMYNLNRPVVLEVASATAYVPQSATAYEPHPQYQEAQQFAEHYYSEPQQQQQQQQQEGATGVEVGGTMYDPNAVAYAQYYEQHGYSAQEQNPDMYHYA